MGDALELQLQLDYYSRQLEERDALIVNLRRDLDIVLRDAADAATRATTLKSVQDTLLREKLLAERHAEQLMREKAELASENARLHVYANDCAARAEAAMAVARELRDAADARAAAEELSLAGGAAGIGITGGAGSDASTVVSAAQLAAARLLIARLLSVVAAGGLNLRREVLLAPPTADADPALRTSGAVAPILEAEVATVLAGVLGLPSIAVGNNSARSSLAASPTADAATAAVAAAEAANLPPPAAANAALGAGKVLPRAVPSASSAPQPAPLLLRPFSDLFSVLVGDVGDTSGIALDTSMAPSPPPMQLARRRPSAATIDVALPPSDTPLLLRELDEAAPTPPGEPGPSTTASNGAVVGIDTNLPSAVSAADGAFDPSANREGQRTSAASAGGGISAPPSIRDDDASRSAGSGSGRMAVGVRKVVSFQ